MIYTIYLLTANCESRVVWFKAPELHNKDYTKCSRPSWSSTPSGAGIMFLGCPSITNLSQASSPVPVDITIRDSGHRQPHNLFATYVSNKTLLLFVFIKISHDAVYDCDLLQVSLNLLELLFKQSLLEVVML